MRYHPTNQAQVCTSAAISLSQPMGRPVRAHSICLWESSTSACVTGAVNTLHLVFAQRADRALSAVLSRMHVAVDKKWSIHPSTHPPVRPSIHASFSLSLPCCLFFLVLWAEEALLVWTSVMCYTTTRFQRGGWHHMRPDSKSITFPTVRRSDRLTALYKQTKKGQCLCLKTNAVCAECYLMSIQTLSSARVMLVTVQPRLWNPFDFFFLSLHNTLFFFSLSQASLTAHQNNHDPACTFRWLSWQLGSICRFPLSGVSPPSELSWVPILHANWKSRTNCVWRWGNGCDCQADRLSLWPFPTKSPRQRQRRTKEHGRSSAGTHKNTESRSDSG